MACGPLPVCAWQCQGDESFSVLAGPPGYRRSSSRSETIFPHPSEYPNRCRTSTLGLQLPYKLSPGLARHRQLLNRRAIESLSHSTLCGLCRVPNPRIIVPSCRASGARNMPGACRDGHDTTGRRGTTDRDTSSSRHVVRRNNVRHNNTGLRRCRNSLGDQVIRDSVLHMRRKSLCSGMKMWRHSRDSRLHMWRKRCRSGVNMRRRRGS